MKLALLTEIIAPYRVPVFNELAQHPEIDLKVFFCSETEQKRDWEIPYEKIRFEYKVMRKIVRRFQHPHGNSEMYLNPFVIFDLYQFKPDVIITGGYHQPTYWLAIVYARLFRRKLILWSESTQLDLRTSYSFKEKIKHTIVSFFHSYVVPGSPQKRYIENLGSAMKKIFIAPNAIDVDFFQQKSIAEQYRKEQIKQILSIDGFIILFVGRLVESKGLQDLIKALALLKEKKITLIVIGEGPHKGEYIKLAKQKKVTAHFLGSKQQTELPTYYSIADIFVFPSHADPWGLVLNEAITCGVPIVASESAGATEDLVTDEWNGFIHAPGDYQEIRQAIEKLIENPELRRKMGENSIKRSASYTPAHCAQGIAKASLALIK